MNHLKYLLISILLILGCSCQENSSNKKNASSLVNAPYPHLVDLTSGMANDNAQFFLSDIADSIKFILLEKTDQTILAELVDAYVDDNNLFIQTSRGQESSYYFRFDLDGRFRNTIGTVGRGPGEYVGSSFNIDYDNKSVIVLAYYSTKEYLRFSYDGRFIEKLPIRKQQDVIRFECLPGGRIVTEPSSTGIVARLPHYFSAFELYNSKGSLTDSMPHPALALAGKPESMKYSTSLTKGIYKYGDEAFLQLTDEDTIYITKGDRFEPAFILNKGKYSPSIEARYKAGNKSKLPFLMDFACPGLLITGTHLYKRQILNDHKYLFEYNIETGNIRSSVTHATRESSYGFYEFEDEVGFIDDLSASGQKLFFSNLTGKNGSVWISWLSATNFRNRFGNDKIIDGLKYNAKIRDQRLQLINRIEDDDNPVVILIYLKGTNMINQL